uniref:Uncharacterized protein n=1 Tax=Siphoviridae sp. ctZF426 TaxID=2827580 RepID=A0A8S5RSC3_9CAUD|nr:MAG TPA: hypothetical protein [Siphoviridae sp. ctZF426]
MTDNITRTAADLTTGDIIDWQHTLHVVIRVTEPDQAGQVKIIAASYWDGDTTSIHASPWGAFTVHDGAVPPPDDAFAIYVKEGRGPDGAEVCGPGTGSARSGSSRTSPWASAPPSARRTSATGSTPPSRPTASCAPATPHSPRPAPRRSSGSATG